jgi:hypothetical protein
MAFTQRPFNPAVLATGSHPLFPRDMNTESPSSSPERSHTTRPAYPDKSSHPSGPVGGPAAAALDLFAMSELATLRESEGSVNVAVECDGDYDTPFDNPRHPNRSFMIPPPSDLTFPPEDMREDPPSANESTFGVLQISNTTTCSPATLLPPETYPVRTWFPITDVFLRTIISFQASGHVCIHQQLALPGGYSPYENSSYPKPSSVADRRQHRSNTVVRHSEPPLLRILEAKPTPIIVPAGILSIKVNIPRQLWKVEAVEAIGGWFIIVLEISGTAKPDTPKKDKKGKGKALAKAKPEKEKLNGTYTTKPEGVKIKEYVEGHVNGRGARELPLWSWGCAMKLATDPQKPRKGSDESSGGDEEPDKKPRRKYSDSDDEEGADDLIPGTNFLMNPPGCRKSKKDKKGKGVAREPKKRHLLSMRVRIDAIEELGGFDELIAHKTADLETKVRVARESLSHVEKQLDALMTALGEEEMPVDTSVTSQNSETVTQLDSVVEVLQMTFVGVEDEDTTAEDPVEAKVAREDNEKMVKRVGELRNLEFVVVGKKRALEVVERQRKERGAWLGIEDWEWQDE